jgi:predicted DNA-binding protein with PD1-like motif
MKGSVLNQRAVGEGSTKHALSEQSSQLPVQSQRIAADAETPTHAVVFEAGDEATDGLLRFAREQDLGAAHFTAIGAFREATLAFFNPESKEYEEIPVDEQTEVLSLTGNVARYEGEPKLHAHAVLGRRDGSTVGGHLMEAIVRPTLEVMLTEAPATLTRRIDDASGLPLIDLQA